jgi:hypothetical protein
MMSVQVCVASRQADEADIQQVVITTIKVIKIAGK